MKEYVITIKVSEQVTEDSWLLSNKCLKVTSDTTIGEIEEWYRKFFKMGHTEFNVTELQPTLKP